MRSRRIVGVLVALATLGIVGVGAGPAHAAQVLDPERYSSTPTGWAWRYTADKAGIDAYAASNGLRVTAVELVSSSPLTFSATMVRNSGTYARTSSWTVNETVASLRSKLPGKRLLDLERYVVNGHTRFAAVLVANTSSNYHSYRWYVNATPASIASYLSAFGGRIVDIDRVSYGRYDVVMVKNAGADAKSHWYYYRQTPAQLKSKLAANKARLVDIEPDGVGLFTVVMVRTAGEYWWWHHAATATQVTNMQAQYGMRIYHIKRYYTSSGYRYAVLLMNNLDSAGTKARQALWGPAGSSPFGFYVKKIDGPVVRTVNPNKQFEPASMIKALHLLTALLAVKNGDATVSEDTTWYRQPDDWRTGGDDSTNVGVCAYTEDGTPVTSLPETDHLSTVLSGMMEQSDNRKTDAVYNRFGRTAINETAGALGMTGTRLNHRIGCTWKAAEVAAPNRLTLADDGRLFEAVYRANDPVLGTGIDRLRFTMYSSPGTSRFNEVVRQEAASLGKPAATADAFIGALQGAYKPGGYYYHAGSCTSTGCTAAVMHSTGGGYVGLPWKVNGATTYAKYVYGTFVEGTFDCGSGASEDCSQEEDAIQDGRATAMREMLRPQIRAALSTW